MQNCSTGMNSLIFIRQRGTCQRDTQGRAQQKGIEFVLLAALSSASFLWVAVPHSSHSRQTSFPQCAALSAFLFLCDPEPGVVSFRRIFETGTPKTQIWLQRLFSSEQEGCVLSTQGAASQDNLTSEICKIRKVLRMMCADGKCTAHTQWCVQATMCRVS